MKQLFLFLFGSVILLTCSRDQGLRPNGDDGYLSYVIAGTETKYSGNYASANAGESGAYAFKFISSIIGTQYSITGQHGPNNIIRLVIMTDSLKPQTYLTPLPPPATTLLVINGKSYTTDHPTRSTQITVNISSHTGGRVEGTFSGKFFLLDINQPIPTDSVTLTGEFKKVQVIY